MPVRKTEKVEEEKQDTKEIPTKDPIHDRMRFYGLVQDTPKEAKKEIGAGRLKGYTDINPMWRIKKLTEVFGPCGFGWWTQNVKFEYANGQNGEIAVFCTLELIVVDPASGERSQPIVGVGGNKFMVNESKGPYCNDEAFKSAYTDALSIACKALGFSHDVYYEKDRTKYSLAEDEAKDNGPTPEDYKQITDRIQKGISMITKDMSKEQKDQFVQDYVVKHIGGVNYMTCKDMGKLKALLAELLSIASGTQPIKG